MALGESLAIGFEALAISANFAADEGDEDASEGIGPSYIIGSSFACDRDPVHGARVQGLARAPDRVDRCDHEQHLFVVVEGCLRVALLVGYLALISLLPDLRRVFEYHAAEHKAINAFEAGADLEPETVQKFSSLIHVRCGTAFLLWVMVIAIFVFALVGRPALPTLIVSRIVLLPVIAGLAYELIRFGSRHPDSRVVQTLLKPGLWLQSLTTREPTLDQVEVSIQALNDVLSAESRSDGATVEVMA